MYEFMISFDHLLDNQYFLIHLSENLMNITLRQLRAFLAVHQTGSFTKAAEKLHLTQSALSGLIKELENNLDLKVFDRTTRQLQISENGKSLLPYISNVLNEMSSLTDEIESLKNLEKGREEGLKEGREEGALDMLFGLVKKGLLSMSEAAKESGMEF